MKSCKYTQLKLYELLFYLIYGRWVEYTGKCRLTVCQLVLITDVPKNPKKGKIVLQLMFRVWILLRRRGVVVPTFPLTTTTSALNVINQKK